MAAVTGPVDTEVKIPHKVWTRDEARLLADIFPQAKRWELINGEIVDRMGKKNPHMFFQRALFSWLIRIFSDQVVQEPSLEITTPDGRINEPEPDILVTRTSFRERSDLPTSDDAVLVVEVSDSTLQLDLKVKSRLYARAGIPEYWVIDIPNNQVVVHRAPQDGAYADVKCFAANEGISPLGVEQSFSLETL